MKLHKEGIGILAKLFIVLTIINVSLSFLSGFVPLKILVLGLSVVIFAFVLFFFRFPHREYKGDTEGKIIAPVFGKVVAIEEVFESEYFQDNRLQISIFMSPFDIHANWYPTQGTVILSKHHKGRFQAAYLPKSSTENERSTIVLKLSDEREILVRQIAGALARRIVTYAKAGDKVHVNDQMGFIKFGSRVDVFLPLGSQVHVSLGQKVVAVETLLATLNNVK